MDAVTWKSAGATAVRFRDAKSINSSLIRDFGRVRSADDDNPVRELRRRQTPAGPGAFSTSTRKKNNKQVFSGAVRYRNKRDDDDDDDDTVP